MARKEENAPNPTFEHHSKTYEGFVRFAVIGTIAVLNFVLCLTLYTFADGVFSKWLVGVGGIIVTLIATAIGIAVHSASWRPNAIVFIGLGLVAIFTFAG